MCLILARTAQPKNGLHKVVSKSIIILTMWDPEAANTLGSGLPLPGHDLPETPSGPQSRFEISRRAVWGALHELGRLVMRDEFMSEWDAAHDPQATPHSMNRREFLRLGRNAIGAIGATAVLTQALIVRDKLIKFQEMQERIWPHNEPKFDFLDGEQYSGQREIALYLPGFGETYSESSARRWRDGSDLPHLLTGYLDYSHDGTDIDTMVRLIREKLDNTNVERITVIGRSMGGLYSFPIIARLGIPVRAWMFMSSPSRLSNGEFGQYGQFVAHLPESDFLATLAKWGVNIYLQSKKDGFKPAEDAAAAWFENTVTGEKARGLQKELVVANGIDIFDPVLQRDLRAVIDPDETEIAYTASENPNTDLTVRVVPSAREIRRAIEMCGGRCAIRGMPYDGHANIEVTTQTMAGWFQQLLDLGNYGA